MPREDTPVCVRTSASAADWWSRPRDESTVNPDGRPVCVSRRGLPFERQSGPFWGPHTPDASKHLQAALASREVERAVYRAELQHNENLDNIQDVVRMYQDTRQECILLKARNAELQDENAQVLARLALERRNKSMERRHKEAALRVLKGLAEHCAHAHAC